MTPRIASDQLVFSFIGWALGFLSGAYLEGKMIMYRVRLHRRRRANLLRGTRGFRTWCAIGKGGFNGQVH